MHIGIVFEANLRLLVLVQAIPIGKLPWNIHEREPHEDILVSLSGRREPAAAAPRAKTLMITG